MAVDHDGRLAFLRIGYVAQEKTFRLGKHHVARHVVLHQHVERILGVSERLGYEVVAILPGKGRSTQLDFTNCHGSIHP